MVDREPKSLYNYNINNKGTAMKTNREKNQEYDAKQQAKVRPQQPEYNWQPLQEVINKWVRNGAK